MKKLPIYGQPRAMFRRGSKGVSSFRTHVIAVLGDGIRRTGRYRGAVRFTRDELVAAGRTDILACDGAAPVLTGHGITRRTAHYLGRKVRTERVK